MRVLHTMSQAQFFRRMSLARSIYASKKQFWTEHVAAALQEAGLQTQGTDACPLVIAVRESTQKHDCFAMQACLLDAWEAYQSACTLHLVQAEA